MKCDEAPEEAPTVSTSDFVRLNCHISINVNYLNQGLSEGLTEKIEKNSTSLSRSSIYTKTSRITRLPKYLTVSFVRFFWKQETKVKAKIMRAVKFPLELDVYEFCTPELQEKMKVPREALMKQMNAIHDNTVIFLPSHTNICRRSARPGMVKSRKLMLISRHWELKQWKRSRTRLTRRF